MAKQGTLRVLHEDEWIIVVSKPAGMLSVGYPGFRGQTALDALIERYKSRGKRHVTAVHRLDRETSGVMMFACSPIAAKRIMDEWQTIVNERRYRCLCVRRPGSPDLQDKGTIDLPIAYNRHDVGFVPTDKGDVSIKVSERAITHYRVLERGTACDLVECELETGRKNQIRVHLAHLGHPIAGDEVYGKDMVDSSPIDRLALHARALAFMHPFTGEPMRFEEAEDAAFLKALRAVSKSKQSQLTQKGANAEGGKNGGRKGYIEAELIPRGDAARGKRHANGSKFIPDTKANRDR